MDMTESDRERRAAERVRFQLASFDMRDVEAAARYVANTRWVDGVKTTLQWSVLAVLEAGTQVAPGM